MTTNSWTVARGAAAIAIVAALLGGCGSSSDGFTVEGTEDEGIDRNAVKAVMQSLGAVDPSEKPVEFKPRAPLVAPPSRTLPAPRDANAVSPNFPRNPEDVADEQRRAALRDEKGTDGRIMTPDEMRKYAIPGAGKINRYDPDPGRRLSPDELRGQGQTQEEAIKRAANPSGRKTLIEPPDQYRKPSPNAPVAAPEDKSSWKPKWWPL
ncbi:MAG: hypothetical protein ABTQ29_01750 [Siculibacillus sp.]